MNTKNKKIGLFFIGLSTLLTLSQFILLNIGAKPPSKIKLISIIAVGFLNIILLLLSNYLLKNIEKKSSSILLSLIRILSFFGTFLAIIISFVMMSK